MTLNKTRYRLFFLGAVLLVAGGLVTHYATPASVTSIVLRQQVRTQQVDAPSVLDAIVSADVGASVAGRIVMVTAEVGQTVKPGVPLAVVDPSLAQANLRSVRAQSEAGELQVQESAAELERLRVVEKEAQVALDRKQKLAQQGFISAAELEGLTLSLAEARAATLRAEVSLKRERANATSSQAASSLGALQLAQTLIKAPFEGVLIQRNKFMGDVVTIGEPIFREVDPASLRFVARFNEELLPVFIVGQPALVHIGDNTFTGHVDRIRRVVDRETREFEIEIAPDRLPPNWAVGQRATVSVVLRPSARLFVPSSWVVQQPQGPAIWVDRRGRAELRPFQSGIYVGGDVEAVSGLSAGEMIVAPDGMFAQRSLRERK